MMCKKNGIIEEFPRYDVLSIQNVTSFFKIHEHTVYTWVCLRVGSVRLLQGIEQVLVPSVRLIPPTPLHACMYEVCELRTFAY